MCMIYLRAFSVVQIIQRRMIGRLMSNELELTWKGVVLA